MRSARNVRPAKPAADQDPGLAATVKLAIQCHNAGDVANAEKLYAHVLLIKPDHALCLHNLGVIRLKRNDLAAALDLLEAAVRADSRRPLFHCTLGTARLQAGDADRSRSAFLQAIELQSGTAAAWDGLGMALHKLERPGESIAAHRRALQLDPQSRAFTRNLAVTLIDAGELEEAEQLYDGLLRTNPLDPDVAIQRGIVRLTRGDFRGWDDYAWSHWSQEWLKTDPPVVVPLPQWDGQSLPDGCLVLYGEQGIGDEIMFASFAVAAAGSAARTMLLCEPRLSTLFTRSFPSLQVAAKPPSGEPPLLGPDMAGALRCSLSRLPGALGATRKDFAGTPYLCADPSAVENWRRRLAALGNDLKVGISWRGGNNDLARATRSQALESLAPLFSIQGVRFINVQYGSHSEEISAFNQAAAQPLLSFDDIDPLRDMDGLAALLSALDLVVSVDNSTVHLAGALGVTTWVLCPFNANWRWTQQGEGSHWYASLRLFRQPESRRTAWAPVIARVANELQDIAVRTRPVAALTRPGPVGERSSASQTSPDLLLINDTAYWRHWGCTGTSLALHDGLRNAGRVVDSFPAASVDYLGPLPANAGQLDDDTLFERFRQRNASLLRRMQAVAEILVNGDQIRGMGHTARALLYLAWVARRRLGKRTSIVNHSCDPFQDPAGNAGAEAFYARVYSAMDHVAVRDATSASNLALLGVSAVQSFDCLPLFIENHAPGTLEREPGRRVVLCGSSAQDQALMQTLENVASQALRHGYAVDVLVGASAFFAQEDLHLVSTLHPRLQGRYRLVTATSERQWLRAIAGAQLLISGHFHHSVAAACLGTPLAVTGDSPAIHGLIETLGLDRDAIWIPPSDPQRGTSMISALLRDPRPGQVPAERLAQLRELAQHNFPGAQAIRQPPGGDS